MPIADDVYDTTDHPFAACDACGQNALAAGAIQCNGCCGGTFCSDVCVADFHAHGAEYAVNAHQALAALRERYAALERRTRDRITRLRGYLEEIHDELEPHYDVEDNGDGWAHRPNVAMALGVRIDKMLARDDGKAPW